MEHTCGHNHANGSASSEIPRTEQLEELAETFKIFADATRMRILCALAQGEQCVCELADATGASQSTVSHQLRLLRAYRLVRSRRAGKAAYYALDDAHVLSIIRAGLDHIQEEGLKNV